MWKDMFFVNNELSQTRIFLAIAFSVCIGGVLAMYFGFMEINKDIVDLIKWILGFVFGTKTADYGLQQTVGSPRGQSPGPKNP